jgi:CrcB protein
MIFVGICGGLGAVSRYALGNYVNNKYPSLFPLGTFIINVLGSFLLGMLNHFDFEKSISSATFVFIGVGFLGGFTTFSTFGYETVQLIVNKKIRIALLYVILSTFVSILAAFIGYSVG